MSCTDLHKAKIGAQKSNFNSLNVDDSFFKLADSDFDEEALSVLISELTNEAKVENKERVVVQKLEKACPENISPETKLTDMYGQPNQEIVIGMKRTRNEALFFEMDSICEDSLGSKSNTRPTKRMRADSESSFIESEDDFFSILEQ